MNDAQWDAVEERLCSFYGHVCLDCDGYRLKLRLSRISTFKNAITFYVNGVLEGGWFLSDCEERRRFFRPAATYLWSTKNRCVFNKMSKKTLKAMNIDPNKKSTFFYSSWCNFKSMRRHLEKNNSSITLIEEEQKEAV